MIAFLKGDVLKVGFEQIVIMVGGVGYGVRIPVTDAALLNVGEKIELHISEVVREQSFDLYGFKDEKQQSLFERLIKVNGVGPRIALVLLGLGSYTELVNAIQQANTAYITGAPGVGKKLAERLVIEMRGGLDDFENDELFNHDSNNMEASAALQALGFKADDAKKMLAKVDNNLPVEEQIKQALRK